MAGKIVLRYVSSGSWGSALTSTTATLADNTQYTIRVFGRQREVTVVKVGESGANFTHGIAARPSNLIAKVAHILKWFNTHGGKQTPAPDEQAANEINP